MLKWLRTAWKALPVWVRAILLGFVIVEVGSTLTVIPLIGNLKFHPEIPWALPATLALLAVIVAWLSGWGPPASSKESRRRLSRKGRVPGEVWRAALPSIVLGTTMLILVRLASPYVVPVAAPAVKINLSAYPLVSVVGGLTAIALSAAVVEEFGFRGFMQKALEERYGLAPAIVVSGVMFWVAHLPDVTITHLPGQLLASVVFGLLAYLTRSLWPAIVAHALADLVLQPTYLFHAPNFAWTALTARPLWEGATATLAQKLGLIIQAMTPEALVNPGPEQLFARLAWGFVAAAVATTVAFLHLARVSRRRMATS